MANEYLAKIMELAAENGRMQFHYQRLVAENKALKQQLKAEKPPKLALHKLSKCQLN